MSESMACVPYLRPKVAARGDIRFNAVDVLEAMACLPTLALGAWQRLQYHAWLRGVLPTGIRDLAALAGVTPRTFEKMLPVLEPLFDRDEQGRLRVYAMEAQRGDLPVAPPAHKREISDELRESYRTRGIEGANKRWKKGDLKVIEGSAAGADGNGSMANGMANEPAVAMADADQLAILAGSGMANLVATPSGAPGPSDGLQESVSKEKIEDTDGRTDAARADAPDGKQAGAVAIERATGSVAGSANGNGNRASAEPAPDVARMANGDGEPVRPETALPGHDAGEILVVLEAAGAGKIPDNLLTSTAIEPIRQLMAEGCDLHRDIVPAVRGFVGGLREPLRTWKAQAIREAAIRTRDRSLQNGVPSVALRPSVHVRWDTPQYQAWLEHTGRKSFPGGSRGWYFDSEWPPNRGPVEPGRRATAAQAPPSG